MGCAMKAQTILAQAYGREIRRQIGDGLRQTYDPMACEPLPSDWLKLIDNLEARRSSPKIQRSGVLERLCQQLRFRE